MKSILLIILSFFWLGAIAQNTFDDLMFKTDMKKDLDMFREMREAANSGVYKYRTKSEIDSIYQWAYEAINQGNTLGHFYNILCYITDFEGSVHNYTGLPPKISASLKLEKEGYFPFILRLVEGQWVCNNTDVEIPIGSKILKINGQDMQDIIPELYRYHTTDGYNITGKQISLNVAFPFYYRLKFGRQSTFQITYENTKGVSNTIQLVSISYKQYKARQGKRHSKSFDSLNYASSEELEKKNKIYYSKTLNDSTAILVVNSFAIGGNAEDADHKMYVRYLDSIFTNFKKQSIKHLIVDVRYNGGGTDPNDLVTYSFLTNRNFQENVEAWIPFRKIPYWNRVKGEFFFLIKPIAKLIYQKELKRAFPVAKNGKYYQDDTSNDHRVWNPAPNAFKGQIYLLVGPQIASAGSLFGAMLASDKTTITIGEETQGGYHGHNGHTPIRYQLKHSKIKTSWSIVNLKQDVSNKSNQPYGYGIIPDYKVLQSHQDFLKNEDTVMKFTLDMIEGNSN